MRRRGFLDWAALMMLMGAFGLMGCRGEAGPTGEDGGSCTVTKNDDGSATISCDDGSSTTVSGGDTGATGGSCSVADNGDGTKTITCDDGTTATVNDGATGEPGTCTVTDNGNGTKTITCDDGTSVVVSDGEDGQNNTTGATAFYLAAEVPSSLVIAVTKVTVAGPPVVEFTVKDAIGRGAIGVLAGSSGNIRFGFDKLVPGANGDPDTWQSYINRVSTGVTQATVERTGTLVDHQDGHYTYTYLADVTHAVDPVTSAAITYDPTLTHRLAIQLSGSVNGVALPYVNATYDFVPDGSAVTRSREVVATTSCNECHGKLTAHGSRYETKYCVTCHNPSTIDPTTGDSVDFAVMIHGIHSASKRATDGAPAYTVGSANFAEVTYPQDLGDCRKCHNGADTATAQGDNWKNAPNMTACSACHANVDFSATGNHGGGAQANNANCAVCHTPSAIESEHLTINATPNNPSTPTGAYNFTYDIKSATVNASNQAVVTFRILKDGAPMSFSSLPADLTGSPSFMVAYASPQSDNAAPVDWNQLGKASAQPATVSIANLINGTQGTLTGPDVDGYYTGTLIGSSNAAVYPTTAIMRGVALQGYYSQTNFGGTTTTLARHAISVFKGVTGDPVRREVVDSAKCANCHEWIEGHGGNRVYTVAVCAVCHNPNLTSSGRGANPANIDATNKDALTAAGYDPANPLTFPEEGMNLKNLIHGLHSSAMRETPFEFVRDRGTSGVFYYDFSEVTFPGVLNTCQTCHKAGTYDSTLPENVLASTDRISDGTDATTSAVVTARSKVPNTTDLVSTQTAATCYSCHATGMTLAHIEQNGGAISVPRTDLPSYVETCDVCHGAGRLADVELVHAE